MLQLHNYKTGKVIQSNLTDGQAATICAKLTEKEANNFPRLLAKQFADGAQLSDLQRFWLHSIALAHQQVELQLGPQGLHPVKMLFQLFDQAKCHLKFPKIRLRINNQPFVLRLGGKNPNRVYVGGPEGAYYGYINRQGQFQLSGLPASAEEVIKQLALQPAETAKAYAQAYGHCMFCGLPLTDDNSTTVGYGPVCADHYGLPWGKS